jgi:Uncharacterized protein conserved in bacteria
MSRVAQFKLHLLVLTLSFLSACDKEDEVARLQLQTARLGSYNLSLVNPALNGAAPVTGPLILTFSHPINLTSIDGNVTLQNSTTGASIPMTGTLDANNTTVSLELAQSLAQNTAYKITVGAGIRGAGGERPDRDQIIEFHTAVVPMEIESVTINDVEVRSIQQLADVDPNGAEIVIRFSHAPDPSTINTNTIKIAGNGTVSFEPQIADNTVTIALANPLADWSKYQLTLSEIKGVNGEVMQPLTKTFYTGDNGVPDHPVISEDELLTLVQQQTFKYFWDFAHPASGMARERNTSGNLVTSGGSGFGLMAIIVGIERGFISRSEGVERLSKIVTFLEGADRFHGAWSHWIDGTTGAVLPFSTNDNGGDLVETALLVQGLITFRQYLDPADATESSLITRINTLWEGVEWDWYTRGGQKVLYWHWSPDKQWTMNLPIRGHNETLITYLLAASSPTHPISKDVYTEGYARNGGIQNGNEFYGITLPLGEDYGGPLFFAQYSFLGLDPRNLQDTYANYWTQNRNHTLINRAYVIENPKRYIGYNERSWGLTASDNNNGYSAHSPANDLGVITPTAALSSFPYTPEESMEALKFYYYSIGDRLWGEYGFYDAYNLTAGWVANSYLAIDQGPIVVMIENYRTGLLWDLFMSAPEIQDGLTTLGFTY